MKHWPYFLMGILASFGYAYCLTFLNAQAVSKIIDRVAEGGVAADQVFSTFNSRFGGALVSQTSKFTNAYSSLVELFNYSLVPLISSTILTIVLLAPLVPLYVVILTAILVVYVVVVWLLFRRTLPRNEVAASAQNRLSGELSDSITNILAVKTSGREAYEKGLFTKANKEVRAADSKRMHATLLSASVAAGIIVIRS